MTFIIIGHLSAEAHIVYCKIAVFGGWRRVLPLSLSSKKRENFQPFFKNVNLPNFPESIPVHL
jgi:hypothetical protein